MPDLEFRNGSTITMMQADGTQREVNAQRITISSDAIPQASGSSDTIYATSSNGERLSRWDTISNSMYFSNGVMSSAGISMNSQTTENPNKRYIQQYNYNPEQFKFHKVDNEEELYLGVELEIDSGGEDETNAQYVNDFMNSATENVYCKHDGSLSRGFEIVTHPCTVEYHKHLQYEELFKELIKKGYRSHDVSTCGLHVHMNRNYFGEKKIEQDLNISKLLYLYEKFWDKVELVARRKSNEYARRFYLEDDESPLDLYVKSKDKGKYGAINLKHKNTIEVRIFKGTLKVDTYYNTLEFVSVMAHIAKETDIYEIQFVTWDKIKSRFSDELNQYIIEREETVKKEDKEKVKEMMNNRASTISSDTFTYCPDGMRGLFTATDMSYETASSELQRRAYEEIARSSRQMVNINMPSFEYDTTFNQRTERSEEEQIQIEINELKTKVRRSRNGLEITNLNRQIAELENQLRRLRRNR